jgi:hypothetical protein
MGDVFLACEILCRISFYGKTFLAGRIDPRKPYRPAVGARMFRAGAGSPFRPPAASCDPLDSLHPPVLGKNEQPGEQGGEKGVGELDHCVSLRVRAQPQAM